MIQPLVCTAWDGTHIWLQWQPAADSGSAPVTVPGAGKAVKLPALYKIRLRFRKPGSEEWENWVQVQAERRAWKVVPAWREGDLCQAEVGLVEGEYERAQEVTFLRASCEFEFATERSGLHYLEGTEFSAVVDGGACHYRLRQEIELGPRQSQRAMMEALELSGYAQLDYPGHFLIRPYLGVTIRNTQPSVNDVEATGRDFGVLAALPRQKGDPVRIAIRKRTRF